MVNLAGEYDSDAPASSGFEPLRPGQYVARIIDAKRDPVSRTNDNGECLNITWKVEGGDADGRLFWQRINMWFRGRNEERVRQIGMQQFTAIREATGVLMPGTTDELLEIPCLVTLKIKADAGYNPRNEVSAVRPLNDPQSPAPAAAAASPAAAAPPRPAKANPFQRAAGQR